MSLRALLIGDVVGLGKTLMATAVARIFEDEALTVDRDPVHLENVMILRGGPEEWQDGNCSVV